MGIRFLCPDCQNRLNVKTFLAGKRGVCPHCEASIRIPLESQILSRKEERAQAAAASKGEPAVAQTTEATAAASRAENHASNNGSGSQTAVAESPPAEAPAPETVETETRQEAAPPRGEPTDSIDIATKDVPVGEAADIPVGNPADVPTGSAIDTSSPPPLPNDDPLDEAPNMVWYVRPPSGGQYGPARGDIMKKWVEEGRVSADSLVWREGWPEWQSANEVLPALAGSKASSPAIKTNDSPAESRTKVRRRRKPNQLALVSVILLVLVSFGLLATLVAKLTGAF